MLSPPPQKPPQKAHHHLPHLNPPRSPPPPSSPKPPGVFGVWLAPGEKADKRGKSILPPTKGPIIRGATSPQSRGNDIYPPPPPGGTHVPPGAGFKKRVWSWKATALIDFMSLTTAQTPGGGKGKKKFPGVGPSYPLPGGYPILNPGEKHPQRERGRIPPGFLTQVNRGPPIPPGGPKSKKKEPAPRRPQFGWPHPEGKEQKGPGATPSHANPGPGPGRQGQTLGF